MRLVMVTVAWIHSDTCTDEMYHLFLCVDILHVTPLNSTFIRIPSTRKLNVKRNGKRKKYSLESAIIVFVLFPFSVFTQSNTDVNTRCRVNIVTTFLTSIQHCIDVKTTSRDYRVVVNSTKRATYLPNTNQSMTKSVCYKNI